MCVFVCVCVCAELGMSCLLRVTPCNTCTVTPCNTVHRHSPCAHNSGKREVFFEVNGVPRVVEVVDKAAEQVGGSVCVWGGRGGMCVCSCADVQPSRWVDGKIAEENMADCTSTALRCAALVVLRQCADHRCSCGRPIPKPRHRCAGGWQEGGSRAR